MKKNAGGQVQDKDDSREHHVRWFGEPWPSAKEPAPVCSERKYRIATPVGEKCLFCQNKVGVLDQGVVMPYQPAKGPAILAPVHLDCLMGDVFGSKMALVFPG